VEKILKFVWLSNGILILIGIMVYYSFYSFNYISDKYQNNDESNQAKEQAIKLYEEAHRPLVNGIKIDSLNSKTDTLLMQNIYIDEFHKIKKEGYYIIPIKLKDFTHPIRGAMLGSIGPENQGMNEGQTLGLEKNIYFQNPFNRSGGVVNYLFIEEKTRSYHYLLNRNGYISRIDLPIINDNSTSDNKKQNYILYSIAFNDDNRDGRISDSDISHLYISDLKGNNLKQILPENVYLYEVTKNFDDNSINLFVKVKPSDSKSPFNDWKQIIYVYSVDRSELSELVSEQVFNQARKILLSK